MTAQLATVAVGDNLSPLKSDMQHSTREHQQCQQQEQQAQRVVSIVEPMTTVIPGGLGTDASVRHRRRASVTMGGFSSSAPPSATLLNPWRALDSQDFVIAYARRGTVKCIACGCKIMKGELQLGAFYMHEDKFTLVRWYHQRCVAAPDCLKDPWDLCGIEDVSEADVDRVLKWLGYGVGVVKDRSWTA